MLRILSYTSLLLALLLCAVYWLRPDWATAMTIFPAWAWLIFALLAAPDFRSKVFRFSCLAWLLFVLIFVEEVGSMSRALLPESRSTKDLRVATINCSGSMAALLSALEERPDIILIQETPQESQVLEWVAQNKGFAYAHGIDASILVRGTIQQSLKSAYHYSTANAKVDGSTYNITSLRLATSTPRMDLWNLDCWKKQKQKRLRQLEQMEEVAQSVSPGKQAPSTILGGDFNVPQGDRVFSLIDGALVDSFKSGGRGWCNTIMSSHPLLRIDQIWTNPNLRCHRAYVKRTPAMDHKMYVADFTFVD